MKIDRDVTQATIIIGHLRNKSRDNPDYYAVSVYELHILRQRWFPIKAYAEDKRQLGLAYDVNSFYHKQGKGLFQTESTDKNESAKYSDGEILKQDRENEREEVSDEELSGAKTTLRELSKKA